MPYPQFDNGNSTNEVLLQYNTITSDSQPSVLLNEISRPGSEHIVIMEGHRDRLVSVVQRQVARPSGGGVAAMEVENYGAAADESDADQSLNAELINTVSHLNGACKGNIPVIVKTLAAAAQIDLDTAQQRVAWAFKNGVEIDYEL